MTFLGIGKGGSVVSDHHGAGTRLTYMRVGDPEAARQEPPHTEPCLAASLPRTSRLLPPSPLIKRGNDPDDQLFCGLLAADGSTAAASTPGEALSLRG